MPSGALNKSVLVHFSGPDAPRFIAELTGILARCNVGILDVGQAVVHETLSFGMLLEIPESSGIDPLRSALLSRATELGLRMQFTEIAGDSINHSVHSPGQDLFIITVLGRSITAAHLTRVSAILAANAMSIDRIDRLSDQLTPDSAQANACVEFAVSGDASRELHMRGEFLATAQELSIDIAFQRESIYRRNRRLFAFDMDSTLIQGEVIDELAKLAGVGDRVVAITEAAMRGEIGFDQSFTRRVGLLKGLSAERVYGLLDAIPLADGAERLFKMLRLLGYKTAILSGGFTFFARSLQQRLGIDTIHANELDIVDGLVTGQVIPPIINGIRKAELLAALAHAENISMEQVVAVGDGANDIPMLNMAGMGIAYRAKPLVRQKAAQSISSIGLDGLLYLIGVRDRDLPPYDPRT